MTAPSNTRVQRTRSSPSALRSPLTRRPLGARIVAVGAIALLVLVRATARGQAACPCPDSIGAEAGSEALIRIVSSSGHPVLLACGYLEKRQADGDVIASEFDVFRCGRKESLLSFGALQTCRLHAEPSRLVVIEFARWPFGHGWNWVDEAAWEYVVSAEGGKRVSKRMVLAAPRLTTAQIAVVLEGYDKCRASLQTCDLEQIEEVVGRTLVAALAGSTAAQQALFSLASELKLDGHGAEVYTSAISLYDAYAKTSRKVPARPGA